MFTFKGEGFPAFHGIVPQIHEEAFVAPQVFLSGDVRIGQYASLWPGVVARGDVDYIGDYVTVGHCACIHGCEIEDHVLIGMGATVLTGAKIGRGSIVAAGAVVKENAVIPPNSLVAGVPAKIVRENMDRVATIHAQALKYKCEWSVEYGVYPEIGGERYHGEKII